MAGPIDSLGLQTEPDKTIPSNLGSSPSFFSAPAIAPMTIKSPVSPSTLSPSAAVLNPFSTNQFTRTGLDMVQKIERLQQLYPATLVSSLPWSYKQDSYDVEEYRAEAALLRAHAGNAWHPPVKQPGLRLLYEALWWLQGEGPADGAGALQTLKDLSYGRLSLAARPIGSGSVEVLQHVATIFHPDIDSSRNYVQHCLTTATFIFSHSM